MALQCLEPLGKQLCVPSAVSVAGAASGWEHRCPNSGTGDRRGGCPLGTARCSRCASLHPPGRGSPPVEQSWLLHCQCSYSGTPCLSLRRSMIPTHSVHHYANVYLAKTQAGGFNFHYSLLVILSPEKFQLIHLGSRNNVVGLGGPGTHRTAASAWDNLHLGEAWGEVCARRHPRAAPA